MFRIQKAAVLIDGLSSQAYKVSLRCHRGLKHTSRVFQEAQKAEEVIRGTPYSKITLGVPKETFLNERRVAIVPATVKNLTKRGFLVNIEENAGVESKFSNDEYAAAGASIKPAKDIFQSDLVLKIRPPTPKEIEALRERNTLISFIYPAQNKDLVNQLVQKHATVFGMECVPRISRAQVFDALSSMANISGYKAVIEAANNFGRFFTGSLRYSIIPKCISYFP